MQSEPAAQNASLPQLVFCTLQVSPLLSKPPLCMSSRASFGTTISSGIQDLSAILSLLGTEQCEVHVGSALRGGGRGGFLYAAVTPLSIFGSLGMAKAAFTIMLLGIPVRGAKILQQMGFDAKGDVVSLLMSEAEGTRYEAESRLLVLLHKYYLEPSAHRISVEQPPTSARLPNIRPWDLKLLGTSALVACLGAAPYFHFVLHRTSFLALEIFFPICRVVGGLLCVFPGQLLLQYRIQMLLRQRLLFLGINNLLHDEVSMPYIRWDETYASEVCLSSLKEFLRTPMDEELKDDMEPFFNVLAQALNPTVKLPDVSEREASTIAGHLEAYLRNTWAWLVMEIFLLTGFLMTLVGYVGCFTIVQNSPNSRDTYIWLGAEALLAFIRLLVWAVNPPWDDPDGVHLIVDCSNRQSLAAESDENPLDIFKPMSSHRFWETLAAYSGVANIDDISGIRGFRPSYSWTKHEKDEILSIILEEDRSGGQIVLCTMNAENLEFYHAELSSADGISVTARKKEKLDDHDSLMKSPNFVMDVFEQYRSILELKCRVSPSSAIQASWALSHCWMVPKRESPESDSNIRSGLKYINVILGIGISQLSDAEDGTSAQQAAVASWNVVKGIVERTMAGIMPTYSQFDDCVSLVSVHSGSRDLHDELSKYLSEHTQMVYKILHSKENNFLKEYDEKWQVYSNAALVLRRLFKPLDLDLVKREREKGRIDSVQLVALKKWDQNVSNMLSDRLGSAARGVQKAIAAVTPTAPGKTLLGSDGVMEEELEVRAA
ncbi:hypothetical protein MSAN_00145200 [Mycena sanguinolenta]|uniref:Cullin N-terminal domain-containing protein n=1 Tax=Mycena sanguinolenta TaxID=230812 RepID=A0A8H6ZGT3_9AGAR|nr:hypothetical protein MSAN_00145200 [Mycena sanguinolenta]